MSASLAAHLRLEAGQVDHPSLTSDVLRAVERTRTEIASGGNHGSTRAVGRLCWGVKPEHQLATNCMIKDAAPAAIPAAIAPKAHQMPAASRRSNSMTLTSVH